VATAAVAYLTSLAYVVGFSLRDNVPQHADAALVLGAKVLLDDSPSEALYNRTLEAVNLYQQGRVTYLLTTGGLGLGPTAESSIARDIARQHGVPASQILAEGDSHTTFENVEDVQAVARQHGIRSVVVVSDQFHVARGVLVAEHFGFSPVYWAYPNIGYYSDVNIAASYLREAAALIFYLPRVLPTNFAWPFKKS
jgi:uncharacterized SAM-binding protein YcdF (DUF218 family)